MKQAEQELFGDLKSAGLHLSQYWVEAVGVFAKLRLALAFLSMYLQNRSHPYRLDHIHNIIDACQASYPRETRFRFWHICPPSPIWAPALRRFAEIWGNARECRQATAEQSCTSPQFLHYGVHFPRILASARFRARKRAKCTAACKDMAEVHAEMGVRQAF